MKVFLSKFLLFATVFFLVDKLFIVVRETANIFDDDRRLEKVLDGEINKNLVIFGSSIGGCAIETSLFKTKLQLDSYNLSYGGSEIEFQTFLLKNLISNNQKPKIVIKLIDDSFELLDNEYNMFRIDRLYPLVKYPVILEELINQGEKNYWLSKLFILHQLNQSNFDFTLPPTVADSINLFGAKTVTKTIRLDYKWIYKIDTVYNPPKEMVKKIICFKQFQQICIDNNIKLILAIPPAYQTVNAQFVSRLSTLVDKRVYFYIYNQDNKEYKSKANFEDSYHLCKRGATIYTNELCDYILSKNLL